MASYSDDFNRASLGANWTAAVGSATINSSVELQVGDASSIYWNGFTPGGSQYAWGRVGTVLDSGNVNYGHGPACRMDTADGDCYVVIVNTEVAGEVVLARIDGGSYNILATDSSGATPAANDTFEIRAVGVGAGNLTVYKNGSLFMTVSDSNFSGGRVGFAGRLWNAATRWTDGAGGDLYSLEQEGYRWRDDDGSESAATWLDSQDTDISRDLSTNTRLRVLVNASGDVGSTQYQLEYRIAGGTYAKVLAAQPTEQIPSFVAKGTFTSGTGALSVPPPAGIQDGDLLLLFVESANEAITTPSGYTQVTNSPQSTGGAAAAGGVRLGVFYKVTNGSESNLTVADTGNHTTAIIMAFRGVDTTTPVHQSAGAVDSSATSSLSCPAVTTSTTNCLIVNAIGLDKDLADADTLSSIANAALSSVTERHDETVASGVGGGLAVITGGKATAGSTGNTTATGDTSTTHAYVTLALAPLAPVPQPILLSPSSNITASGAATTAQLTAPSGKTTSDFTTGRIQDDENPADAVDISADDYTELEWCLTAESGIASDSDVYEFRVTENGTPFGTYAVTPEWTIAVAGGAETLEPPLLTNSSTLYAPAIATGSLTLAPPLLSNSSTLHGPTLVGGALTLAVPLLSNSSTLHAPTVTIGGVAIAPPLLSNTSSLFEPVIALGGVALSPPLIASGEQVFAPAIATGSLSLALPLLSNTSTLYAPTVNETGTPDTVSPPLLDSGAQLFAPAVLAASNAVAPPLLINAAVLMVPTVSYGPIAVILPLLPSGAQVFAPRMGLAPVFEEITLELRFTRSITRELAFTREIARTLSF